MRRFGRQVHLQVAAPGKPGRSWDGVRIAFEVERKLGRNPDTATIRAWNLSADSIELFQRPRAQVRLLAGYDVPHLLIQGEPIRGGVKLERQGPDRVLSVEISDGGRVQATPINVSFATGTRYSQIARALAEAMGLPAAAIQLPEDGELAQGVTLTGPARGILDRLATATGADWTVQDGQVRVLSTGSTTVHQGPVFSAKDGNLVGSPSPLDRGLEIIALLDASIRPGDRYRVESELYTGTYKAVEVSFEGDSGWDASFYVRVKGREVSA